MDVPITDLLTSCSYALFNDEGHKQFMLIARNNKPSELPYLFKCTRIILLHIMVDLLLTLEHITNVSEDTYGGVKKKPGE